MSLVIFLLHLIVKNSSLFGDLTVFYFYFSFSAVLKHMLLKSTQIHLVWGEALSGFSSRLINIYLKSFSDSLSKL